MAPDSPVFPGSPYRAKKTFLMKAKQWYEDTNMYNAVGTTLNHTKEIQKPKLCKDLDQRPMC